jgi:hypothetical protein
VGDDFEAEVDAEVDVRATAAFGDDFEADVDVRATAALGVVDRDGVREVVAVRLRRAGVAGVRLAVAFFRWGLVPVAAMVSLSARNAGEVNLDPNSPHLGRRRAPLVIRCGSAVAQATATSADDRRRVRP